VIEALLEEAVPGLEQDGDAAEVESAVREIMSVGNGANRQRIAYRNGASLVSRPSCVTKPWVTKPWVTKQRFHSRLGLSLVVRIAGQVKGLPSPQERRTVEA
jgi:hypothetical protein